MSVQYLQHPGTTVNFIGGLVIFLKIHYFDAYLCPSMNTTIYYHFYGSVLFREERLTAKASSSIDKWVNGFT